MNTAIILTISEKDSDSSKNSSQNERLVTQCKKCGKTFSTKVNLKLHIKKTSNVIHVTKNLALKEI